MSPAQAKLILSQTEVVGDWDIVIGWEVLTFAINESDDDDLVDLVKTIQELKSVHKEVLIHRRGDKKLEIWHNTYKTKLWNP